MIKSSLFHSKGKAERGIILSVICFALFASYVYLVSIKAPYIGIVFSQTTATSGVVMAVNEGGKALDWGIQPGDRLLSAEGNPFPRLYVKGAEAELTKAASIVVEKRDGQQLVYRAEARRTDFAVVIISLMMEAVLLGIGWYAVRAKPESRVIRQFYTLNYTMALIVLTIYSREKSLSDIVVTYCAIWLPYLIFSFYLLFVFRAMHSRFGKQLLAVRMYSIALSAYIIYLIASSGEVSKWVSDLLNLSIALTLITLAGITLFYWKSFHRLERSQLLLLFAGLFLSMMPLTFLYAVPVLLGSEAIIPLSYALIGLLPFSGLLTYLLVVRSLLTMKISSRSLLHNRRTERLRENWMSQQKLSLSIQLSEKKMIRDRMKRLAYSLHGMMDIGGVCLIWRQGRRTFAYATRIYSGTENAVVSAGMNSAERLAQQFGFNRVIKLSDGNEEQALGFLCLGYSPNHKRLTDEEEQNLFEAGEDAVRILTETARLSEYDRDESRVREQLRSGRKMSDVSYDSEALMEELESHRMRTTNFLHDNLLQNLIFLSRDLEELHDSGSASKDEVAVWLKCVYDSQRDIRALCDELYPPIIDEGNLKEALQWLLRTMKDKGDTRANLRYELETKELERDTVKIGLFRAIREIVYNVFKHAQAEKMTIHLREDEHAIYCKIEDNGRGFDVSRVFDSAIPGERRFGLLSVHSQIRRLGGDVDIHSELGKGTVVTIILPLDKEAYDDEDIGKGATEN